MSAAVQNDAAATPIRPWAPIDGLRMRWPKANGWLIHQEVNDSTGANARRRADVVAMNLWPSRGHQIHGVEVKSHRGDWLRELKQPAKSGPIQRFCDHWWVFTPKDLVQPSELPPTWGLLEWLPGGRTKVKVDAPKLQAEPLSRGFLAAMLQRDEAVYRADLERLAQNMTAEKVAVARENAEDDARRARTEADILIRTAGEIKAATGIDLWCGWDFPQTLKLLRLVTSLQSGGLDTKMLRTKLRGVRNTTDDLRRAADAIAELLAVFEPDGEEAA